MKNIRFAVVVHYIILCIKWGIFSVLTGIACGCIGSAFCLFVQWSNELRGQHPWLLFLLPVAGVLIVKLYDVFDLANDRGVDLIFDSVRNADDIPFQVIITSFLSTIFTHLFGGSAGRVGVAIQMGGGVSHLLSDKLGIHSKDRSLFVMCGMSGLISALFGCPLMATFFSMEVVNLGVIYYAALFPCLVTAITSYFFTRGLQISPMRFELDAVPSMLPFGLLKVSVLAILCALVSILFCAVMMLCDRFFKSKLKNRYIRILVGSGSILVLTLLVGSQIYNGSSAALLNTALSGGQVNFYDFLLKIIFTGITLHCGYKGGAVYPALVIGATFGCFCGSVLGLPAGFAAAIGMIAVFCGSVNCPISSLFFAVEIFGGDGILFFAIAVAVSFVLSGYFTIFPGQQFIYSKLHLEYRHSELHEKK